MDENIESEVKKLQEARMAAAKRANGSVSLGTNAQLDKDIYGTSERSSDDYVMSIDVGRGKGYASTNNSTNNGGAVEDEDDEYISTATSVASTRRPNYTAPRELLEELEHGGADEDPFAQSKRATIADRENDYQARRRNRILPMETHDAFASGQSSGGASGKTYREALEENQLLREEAEVLQKIKEMKRDGIAPPTAATVTSSLSNSDNSTAVRKRRWDQADGDSVQAEKKMASTSKSDWDDSKGAVNGIGNGGMSNGSGEMSNSINSNGSIGNKSGSRWDADESALSSAAMSTSEATSKARRSRWDETPIAATRSDAMTSETPKRKSRWDETPSHPSMGSSAATPMGSAAFSLATPMTVHGFGGAAGGGGGKGAAGVPMTPGSASQWEQELSERNRYLTDEELDSMFPPEGYRVINPPATYVPIRTPARKLLQTPHPMGGSGFFMQDEQAQKPADYGVNVQPAEANLPELKPQDTKYFSKLLVDVNEDELSAEEAKERRIMKLLLKIKNGTPPLRKAALRQMTEKAREFGPGPLFNQILPLLTSDTLEDQERHLLVKVIDRILYKLEEQVRPFVHKILVVIAPLLIDEDYYARCEGREIISNLAKAAGLPTMISTMRQDIDHVDEYVRNTTARAFAVVASSLGIPSMLPFLRAVCKSQKSWQARHTGIKIVQQIAILVGCAILPHLRHLVEIVEEGLLDEQQKVRTITALSLAALAEAATPYGIESFDSVLKPLWKGIKKHSGKGLAAFLKAIGHIIPLMDSDYARYYTTEVMEVLVREFASPDPEMKLIVLKVVKQCCATDGIDIENLKTKVLPEFFKQFWVPRMASEKRSYKQLVETTIELANRLGVSHIVERIVNELKDGSEIYRRMTMETVEKIIANLGTADIGARLEEQLIDGILYAFQEQVQEDPIMLNGFGTVVNSLGTRVKKYLPQIYSLILFRLSNKAARVRQQAADLVTRIAVVMMTCDEEKILQQLGVILYENLGEEYPEVLGSILSALKAIVNVVGMANMTPNIRELLPRLTPILNNRHEKVQENCIDLVGRIADRAADYVLPKEWMRVAFQCIEILKAPKKSIRRAAVNTFGYIAKAIGPHDVLATLLNNLKVQERQNRVCTTVAIAIVAETCAPFTVLPALMNEYRVPELNVQNGVLKSLSFLFEYIGEMGKDYIYAVTPLLEDALIDRDAVHRQTACAAIKHMSLGVAGLGCEDALTHLLNYVWPNIFETSAHVINAVLEAIEGLRIALGSCRILLYTLQGLFHPARRVRDVYWKIYNSMYIGAQDALVAHYPRINDDDKNMYIRRELDYVL